jgi:hypothetical protein
MLSLRSGFIAGSEKPGMTRARPDLEANQQLKL